MRKIGIIDSGIGGLTILKKLVNQGLEAEFYYISDEPNVPYGEKSQGFMLNQMKSMSEKLIRKDVDGVLVACNTATAETIDQLRESFEVPFIGIEPYINYINKIKEDNQKVCLILTNATYNSTRFKELARRLDSKSKISIYPLKDLAIIIESLKYKKFNDVKKQVNQELKFLKDNTYTHIILGCTHYPIINSYIEREYNITTIDPSDFVVNQLIKKLEVAKDHKIKTSFFYNYNNTDHWKIKDLSRMSFLNLE